MNNESLKILLIEDNPADARLIKAYLAENDNTIELQWVDRLTRGVDRMLNDAYDVLLLDLSLPDSHGLDSFMQMREWTSKIPVIVLTGLDDESMAMSAVRTGAQDYLVKDHIDAKSLSLSLRHAVERQRLRVKLNQRNRDLAASEDRRRNIIEKNADGIILINHEGIVRFINPAAEAILGRNQAELLDAPFGLPIVVGDTTQLDIVRRDGETAVVEMRLVETEWKGEHVLQASLRDITEHQRIKAELAQKANELEARNIELDEFNHTMAHQIQSLLAQIVGYSSYIEMMDGLSKEMLHMLGRVIQSGHKMSNIINELLLLSSVRRGNISMIPLDMERIVAQALKRLQFQIRECDGEIDQPSSWPVVLGHPPWVEEVWVNYIGNGLKYGGSPPHLKLGSDALPDGMVRYWVRDNGQGITPEDQKKLFKPHTRLQHHTRVQGKGLGLSIVRRIVAKCDGQVGVISELDSGSAFWFTLPVAPPQPPGGGEHD